MMKLSTNIETLFGNPVTDQLVDEILDNQTVNHNSVILTVVHEPVYPEAWKFKLDDLVDKLHKKIPNIKITLVLNTWFKNFNELQPTSKYTIVYIDYYLLSVYYRVFELGVSTPAASWDSTNNSFLFLTGKPDKPNRVRLLYKFKQAGLLTHATWSLFKSEQALDRTRKLLPELTDNEVLDFLEFHYNNPDDIELVNNDGAASVHYGGTPFSTKMYQRSLFQVFPETGYADPGYPYLTEKTYLPIINKRPFIAAGQDSILSVISKMGFRTFDPYLKVSYDNVIDDELRLDTIVQNTSHWLSHLREYSTQVNNDVEHNFRRFVELAKENIQTVESIAQSIDSTAKYMDIINFVDPDQYATWSYWYDRVRDPSWPDCPTEEDFTKLPDWIQKECIELHGYNPS